MRRILYILAALLTGVIAVAAMVVLWPKSEEEKMEALIGRLHSSRLTVRDRAFGRLSVLGEKAVPSLANALERSGGTDVPVLDVLAKLGPDAQEAIPVLVRLLGSRAIEDTAARGTDNWLVPTLARMGPAAIRPVADTLRHGGALERARAAKVLVMLGPDVVPSVIPLLKDENENVRITAVEVLSDLSYLTYETVEPILPLMTDTVPMVRKSAVTAIGRMGKRGCDVSSCIVAALNEEHPVVRLEAAFQLSQYPEKIHGCLPVLAEMLKDENPSIRGFAYTALARLGPAAIDLGPNLTEALDLERGPGRLPAIRALARIDPGSDYALDTLLKVLQSNDCHDRACAAEVLAKIKPIAERTIPVLGKVLEPGWNDDRDYAFDAVLKTLGGFGPDAIPALVKALKTYEIDSTDGHFIRLAEVIGRLSSGTGSVLQDLMREFDQNNKGACVIFCDAAQLGPKAKEVIQTLIWGVGNDEDPRIRVSACKALEALADAAADAIPALLDAQADDDQQVRMHAAEALHTIQGKGNTVQ